MKLLSAKTPADARLLLARRFYEIMEHYDPREMLTWSELRPEDRQFYADAIAELLDWKDLVELAMAPDGSDSSV